MRFHAAAPDALWQSEDGGVSWPEPWSGTSFTAELIAIAAPDGFVPVEAVIPGTADGKIVWG